MSATVISTPFRKIEALFDFIMVLSKWKTAQVVLAAYTPLLVVVQSGLPAFAISFYLSHPWKLMLATFALPIFTLIYTKPDSPLRLVVLPFVALGAVCYHATSGSIMPNRAIAAALDGPFMLLFLISVDALVLQRLHLAKDGTEKTGTSSRKEVSGRRAELDAHSRTEISSFWCAVAWAFHIIFSYRAIGSQREAKNIPKFSYSDPNFVPARSSLLLQRGFAIIIGFLFVDFVTHQPSPRSELFPPHNASLFPAMSDFTVESITIRVFSTLFFWTTLHITISLIYNAVSFIGLATFLTSPADWPPYFGSAKEAYTLRRFWGVFWHSGLRNALLSTAEFFTYDVLRLPRKTALARYVNIFLTFAISGIIHKLVDDTSGIPASENTVYILFFMQALGIMIEDGVEFGYHVLQLKGQRRVKPGTRGWQKLVGYIWVGAWLVWTTPSWSYANIRHDGDHLFPFSAIELMKTWSV